MAICAPATLIERLARAVQGSDVVVGGQDNHVEASGAFTGNVSAEMLADAGARMVILGHSERRSYHGETDALVAARRSAVVRRGGVLSHQASQSRMTAARPISQTTIP